MEVDKTLVRKTLSKDLTNIMIRISLIAFLVIVSVKIVSPFLGLMAWALILAVTLYPVQQKLAKKFGGNQGRASTIVVLLGILLIGAPTVMLVGDSVDFLQEAHTAFENKTVSIKPPPASVAEWPLIGKKLHSAWSKASTDLPALLKKHEPRLINLSKNILGVIAGATGGLFMFLFALIIAGVMMAYGQSGSQSMSKIISRLTGSVDKGDRLHKLSIATIRSVSLGVIGVALIQALLLGIGFVWADIPAAGVLAGVVLVLGIAQLPALLISLPAIAYVWWSGDSSTMNIVYTVYLLLAGMADNFLKPLLLGRGVDAPMPIILLGAIGGMISNGLVGLFVGSVLLALGYVIFMEWVEDSDAQESDPDIEDVEQAVATDP